MCFMFVICVYSPLMELWIPIAVDGGENFLCSGKGTEAMELFSDTFFHGCEISGTGQPSGSEWYPQPWPPFWPGKTSCLLGKGMTQRMASDGSDGYGPAPQGCNREYPTIPGM